MKQNIIEYIIKNTDLKQKDIAEKLRVSPAQISKWKAGETIPSERCEELNRMAGLFGNDVEWSLLVKSEDNGRAWFDYFSEIVEFSDYDFRKIDDIETTTKVILMNLQELGFPLPEIAPNADDLWEEDYELTTFDEFMSEYLGQVGVLQSWCDVYCPVNPDELTLSSYCENLYGVSNSLALINVDESLLEPLGIDKEKLAANLEEIVQYTRSEILKMCNHMRSRGIAFATDYFDYVNCHPEMLDNQCLISNTFDKYSVDQFLPYAERKILRGIEENNNLLKSLLSKLLLEENAK